MALAKLRRQDPITAVYLNKITAALEELEAFYAKFPETLRKQLSVMFRAQGNIDAYSVFCGEKSVQDDPVVLLAKSAVDPSTDGPLYTNGDTAVVYDPSPDALNGLSAKPITVYPTLLRLIPGALPVQGGRYEPTVNGNVSFEEDGRLLCLSDTAFPIDVGLTGDLAWFVYIGAGVSVSATVGGGTGCGCNCIADPESGLSVGSCPTPTVYSATLICGQGPFYMIWDGTKWTSPKRRLQCGIYENGCVYAQMSAASTDPSDQIIKLFDASDTMIAQWEGQNKWNTLCSLRMNITDGDCSSQCMYVPEPCLNPVQPTGCGLACIDDDLLVIPGPNPGAWPSRFIINGHKCLYNTLTKTWDSGAFLNGDLGPTLTLAYRITLSDDYMQVDLFDVTDVPTGVIVMTWINVVHVVANCTNTLYASYSNCDDYGLDGAETGVYGNRLCVIPDTIPSPNTNCLGHLKSFVGRDNDWPITLTASWINFAGSAVGVTLVWNDAYECWLYEGLISFDDVGGCSELLVSMRVWCRASFTGVLVDPQLAFNISDKKLTSIIPTFGDPTEEDFDMVYPVAHHTGNTDTWVPQNGQPYAPIDPTPAPAYTPIHIESWQRLRVDDGGYNCPGWDSTYVISIPDQTPEFPPIKIIITE